MAQVETLFIRAYQNVVKGERNRAIARRMLLDGVLMKDAAQEFGITHYRVGQLRLKALRLLRHPTRSRPLKVIFKGVLVCTCGADDHASARFGHSHLVWCDKKEN